MSSPCATVTSGPLPALMASGIFEEMSAHCMVTFLTVILVCDALNWLIRSVTSFGWLPPVHPFQNRTVNLGRLWAPAWPPPPPAPPPPPPPLQAASAADRPSARAAAAVRANPFF